MAAAALLSGAAIFMTASCQNNYDMGTYGYDANLLADCGIETVELSSPDGKSRILVVPCWQGRVLTSTTEGSEGISYGWVNAEFIRSGENNPQFNSWGGEERFWLGPEGGAGSWFFKKGDAQVYANWKVPAVMNTDAFEVYSREAGKLSMGRKVSLLNASDVRFEMELKRDVTLLDRAQVSCLLGIELPKDAKVVAYRTDNTILNDGDSAWTRETGVPSVWLLGCFNPTRTTTVFIPYETLSEGPVVKDDYFGKLPSERLVVRDGFIFFKIDGEYRAKIGLPKGRAKDLVASYDRQSHVLTILKYSLPAGEAEYVNSQWGLQDDAFGGDVINSYNDGPTDTGVIMGPFYEIETSSPGAFLAPGQSLTHTQFTLHIQGNEQDVLSIIKSVFGLDSVMEF